MGEPPRRKDAKVIGSYRNFRFPLAPWRLGGSPPPNTACRSEGSRGVSTQYAHVLDAAVRDAVDHDDVHYVGPAPGHSLFVEHIAADSHSRHDFAMQRRVGVE